MSGPGAPEIAYDPFSVEARTDPFPMYRELRRHHRAYPLPHHDAWAIPRFADVWDIGADRELTSITEGPVFSPGRLRRAADPWPPGPEARPLRSFSMMDPPAHTVLRKAMVGPFRPQAVAALEQPMRQEVRRLLAAGLERGAFDVVADLAAPAVATATCRLLGVPVGDHGRLAALVNRSLRRDPTDGGSGPGAAGARSEIHDYLAAWAGEQRGRGGLVDALAGVILDTDPPAVADPAGGPPSDAEIATQVGTLLAGGVETVPKILAGGMLALWRHPDQWAALAADPSRVPDACEEIMRLEAPLQWVGRTMRVDAELAGTPMRAGQRLFLLLACANRDEHEFEDPDHLDIGRRPARTLAFGHGTHFCIGAGAARLELRVLLEELASSVGDFAVDLSGVVRPPSEFQLGYTAMPVTVSPPARRAAGAGRAGS